MGHKLKMNSGSNNNQDSLGIIILAGGKSSRMKSNKVFLNILGEPLIKRVVGEASKASRKIIVAIGKNDNKDDYTSILPKWVKVVHDKNDKKTPLYGTLAGLENIKTEYVLLLAADIPFVNADVIKKIHEEAKGFDMAIPIWENGNIEPLYAVYNVPTIINAFKESYKKGEVRIRDAMTNPVEKFKGIDNKLNCFININNPEDLQHAIEITNLKETTKNEKYSN